MIPLKSITLLLVLISVINCQRPSFAGPRPQSGYKDRFKPETNATSVDLSDRFDEALLSNQTQRPPVFGTVVQPETNVVQILSDRIDATPASNSNLPVNVNPTAAGTTQRIPYDALGDKELVDRLNRLPADQRPFWLLNAQAIEANRNRPSGGQVAQQQPQQTQQQQLQQLQLLQQQQQQQQQGSPSLTERLPLPQNTNLGSQPTPTQLAVNRPEADAALLQSLSTDLLLQVLSSRLQSSTPNPRGVSGENLIEFESKVDDANAETMVNDEPKVDEDNLETRLDEANIETRFDDLGSLATTVAPNTAGFPNYGNLQ